MWETWREIQFGGFAALAMNALVNNAAQLRWRWGAKVPLTVRIPLGGKTRSGPFHANIIESWFINDPGLIVVFPSTPQDAYDMLIESHSLPDPVVFLEHLGLYGLRGGSTGWGDNINQLVDTAAKVAGKKISKNHIDGPLGVRGRNSNNDLIREKLGWDYSQTLEQGIRKTYKWIKEQIRNQ